MATPRVFVSSTCYDLQEVRSQLHHFIKEIGYEPVLSEFGDIFYDPKMHVQDACRNEVDRCHIFVLIIGNSYGSLYHRHKQTSSPDSVVLQEFRKALGVRIPQFICVNKYVKYDYDNYRRALGRVTADYFAKNVVADGDEEKMQAEVRKRFDESYYFTHEQYNYIFRFLDVISDLEENNAIFTFDSFDDIRDAIRKQWAGLLFASLVSNRNVAIEELEDVTNRLERIENQLRLLAEGRKSKDDSGNVTFDVRKLASEMEIKDLEDVQEQISSCLETLTWHSDRGARLTLRARPTEEQSLACIDGLNSVVQRFRMSKEVNARYIFHVFNATYFNGDEDLIPYKTIFELHTIARNLAEEDKMALARALQSKLERFYEPPPAPRREPASTQPPPDEIPF